MDAGGLITGGRAIRQRQLNLSRGDSGVARASEKMTRRLPEGPWDPTKIPRIQILMSQDGFLVESVASYFPR